MNHEPGLLLLQQPRFCTKKKPRSGDRGKHAGDWSVSELCRVCALELELQLVRDEGDELGIGGLALGVGYGIAEEALEGI